MCIPASVLQVQRSEQDLNVLLIKSLFNNKDKNIHRSKVIYKGDCSCGVDYIGETVRNLAVRIAEHSNPAHTSEPAKHLRVCHSAGMPFCGYNILSTGLFSPQHRHSTSVGPLRGY